MDGDGRGGAALSMRAVTGKPIKFVGLGEKLDALEEFHPDRIAGRILGMGDIVALVEKAQETIEAEQAERMMKRFQKGQFNMNDLKGQLQQMQKMGGMSGVMGMLPGMGKMQKQMDEAGIDDKMLRRQIALINSMTKKERRNPELLQASRKKRIAAGAGPRGPGAEPAPQDAPPDGRRDEEARRHGQEGPAPRRPRRALRQGRRHAGGRDASGRHAADAGRAARRDAAGPRAAAGALGARQEEMIRVPETARPGASPDRTVTAPDGLPALLYRHPAPEARA